ncbi:MAG: hypothetical protein L0177_14905 [Chloroflexi bacterium]|nr:hypothetical protein [Chloroflexota bacterium]
MLILIAILLALIPAIAILYPFVRGRMGGEVVEDESAPQAALQRRWDSAVAGLRSAALEYALGNLAEEDYRWLREQYMLEAAQVMKAMELEFEQEEELLASITREMRNARLRVLGANGAEPSSESESLSDEPSEQDAESPRKAVNE